MSEWAWLAPKTIEIVHLVAENGPLKVDCFRNIEDYKGNPFVERDWSSQLPFCWHSQRRLQEFPIFFVEELKITHQEMGPVAGGWSLQDCVVPHTT